MSKPKRTFTTEFKRDAIALAERGDHSVAQIERDLGLSAGCLRHWRADARRAAAAGTTTDALADQARELQRLRCENARLREEREILKKAVAMTLKGTPYTHHRAVPMDSRAADQPCRADPLWGARRGGEWLLRLAQPPGKCTNDGRPAASNGAGRHSNRQWSAVREPPVAGGPGQHRTHAQPRPCPTADAAGAAPTTADAASAPGSGFRAAESRPCGRESSEPPVRRCGAE
ncbi:MAG: transposase [Herpetosiphonaceae bacterium]|nr:transposase [Herpetosiphonaceae bacterium]